MRKTLNSGGDSIAVKCDGGVAIFDVEFESGASGTITLKWAPTGKPEGTAANYKDYSAAPTLSADVRVEVTLAEGHYYVYAGTITRGSSNTVEVTLAGGNSGYMATLVDTQTTPA